MENQFATAEELLQESAHQVVLPGYSKPVLLRQPDLLEFAVDGRLPPSIAAKAILGPQAPDREPSPEESKAQARFILDRVCACFIQPQAEIGAEPGSGKIDPLQLKPEARLWLYKFSVGEIDASGRSVGGFRREPGVSDAGGDGGEISPVAVESTAATGV